MERTKKPDWDPMIRDIEIFFSSHELPNNIQLDCCTKVVGVKGFVDTHLAVVNKHSGMNTYKPYLMRLVKLKKLLT